MTGKLHLMIILVFSFGAKLGSGSREDSDVNVEIPAEINRSAWDLGVYKAGIKAGIKFHAEPVVCGAAPHACPCSWDTNSGHNAAIANWLDKCTTGLDWGRHDHLPQRDEINTCGQLTTVSTRRGNNYIIKPNNSEFPSQGTGGVCMAKAYYVKCDAQGNPCNLPLFRVWSSGAFASSKMPEFGGYWTAYNPDQGIRMTKGEYKNFYAICDNWNPDLDMISRAVLTKEACGAAVIVGNGEAVNENICPLKGRTRQKIWQTFPYSPYLQLVLCRRPELNGDNLVLDIRYEKMTWLTASSV